MQKLLLAIAEGKMNKERWYKLHSLETTLKTLGFLGTKNDWQISFVAIGKRSKGIAHLEGNVQVLSVESFKKIFSDFTTQKNWAPLRAIRAIIGYNVDFFKIRA